MRSEAILWTDSVTFRFAGVRLVARTDGALWWPEESTVILADLHLGKAERLARLGGSLLPPWGETETLAKLERALTETEARRVVVLGDAFDDCRAASALAAELRSQMVRLAARREWLWIEGNHDAGFDPARLGLPGRALESLSLCGLTLRHQAGAGPDISAHVHPVVRLAGQKRPAFLVGDEHLILPAFGHFTGGLEAQSPQVMALVPKGFAILTGQKALAVPWPFSERG